MVDMLLPFIVADAGIVLVILWDILKNVRIIADKFKQEDEKNGKDKK